MDVRITLPSFIVTFFTTAMILKMNEVNPFAVYGIAIGATSLVYSLLLRIAIYGNQQYDQVKKEGELRQAKESFLIGLMLIVIPILLIFIWERYSG